jgi:hypothetical protein
MSKTIVGLVLVCMILNGCGIKNFQTTSKNLPGGENFVDCTTHDCFTEQVALCTQPATFEDTIELYSSQTNTPSLRLGNVYLPCHFGN